MNYISMSTLNMAFALAVSAFALADMGAVFARDLMMFQQNSYRDDRYLRWFEKSGESTSLRRIFCCVALMSLLIGRMPLFMSGAVASVIVVWQLVALLKAKYKKPLVWTPRVKRICSVMWVLAAAVALLFGLTLGVRGLACSLVGMLVVSPVLMLAANGLLRPVEKRINKKYYDEAASILASMPSLKVVGITGSYGKTSTKHYLTRILQEHFAVTMTPGSFNTTMGVIRTVREHLRPYDEVFVCEMGAKQIGDIKEICDLVHPSVGIVTAVGEQHLESFKTVENVCRTKFELVDALPADGLAVVNNDFPHAASREVGNVECLRYAVSSPEGADYKAEDVEYSPEGTSFAIVGKGLEEPLRLRTKLVGECNISNLMAAVIVALRLGVPAEKIRYAVEQIDQVEHRLNMKRTPGGVTIIDDAFNSNPAGSRMALDVLSRMTGGRRIVVTPGMIELGAVQERANEEFGRHAARCADIAIVVGAYNRGAILAGLAEGPIKADDIHAVDSFAEAQKLLGGILRAGDTVLYENDLPDTFK